MAKSIGRIKEQCGCKKCTTYAEITRYDCGCVAVIIYNDSAPCAECTRFSKKRKYCGQYGYPQDHKGRQ